MSKGCNTDAADNSCSKMGKAKQTAALFSLYPSCWTYAIQRGNSNCLGKLLH